MLTLEQLREWRALAAGPANAAPGTPILAERRTLLAVLDECVAGREVVTMARNVRDSLVPGFVVCQNCGDQEDTGTLDWVRDLDAALKTLDAEQEPTDAR